MDPNIMKLLEEDEDETMHSGADVEAFTAELNRDIEGTTSVPQQATVPDASSQDNNHARQLHQLWQTSDHDESSNFQREQDLLVEQKDKHLSHSELQKDRSNSEDRKEDDNSSHEFRSFHLSMTDASPQQKDDQEPVSSGVQGSGRNPAHVQGPDSKPFSEKESQVNRLQHMSGQQPMVVSSNSQSALAPELNDVQSLSAGRGDQQTSSITINNGPAMATVNQHSMETGINGQQTQATVTNNQQPVAGSNRQSGSTLKLNKQVPFGMLLPIIQPQLDKERAAQLHNLYFKLKRNEISKDGFVRNMRSIVGDQMLKMAVYKLQTQAARNSQTPTNQYQSPPQASGQQLQVLPNAQIATDIRNSTDSNIVRSHVVDSQVDSKGLLGINKQQQTHFSQTSFPQYGSSGGTYSHFSATNSAASTSIRPQLHDSQLRQAPAQLSTTPNNLRPTTHNMNVMNMPKFERPPSANDPKKMQASTLTTLNSNTAPHQNLADWPPSSSQEPKFGVSSSITYAKQEPMDQSSELHHRTQLNSSQGLSILTSQQSMGNHMGPPKKPLAGQKKSMETPGSSPPSSKKQKVAGAFSDQSIEQLNDVTAVSGVNLREEEEQLFSRSKEDSRVSEASRRVVQEEEERLILHKIPLQKKVVEIMGKCGLKNMSSDVERCLSLCVEERMRGLIANLIRFSKQRVDMEKPRHRTVITSDIRRQIMIINNKGREEWEKKQAETEKSQNLNEPESDSGVDCDKEKDENRGRSAKAHKDEDDKMRTTAANVAVRAATGVGDMMSKWQSMIEAKQKQGGSETSSGSQPGKDVARKPSSTIARNTRENEAEKRDRLQASNAQASVRKVGRNQVVVPRVARSISVKDVIAILERDPQMSRSTLIYRLYNRVSADTAVE